MQLTDFLISSDHSLSSDKQLDQSAVGKEFDLGQSAGVTSDQIEQLKRDVASNLNDALFKRLKDMEEVLPVHCYLVTCAFFLFLAQFCYDFVYIVIRN